MIHVCKSGALAALLIVSSCAADGIDVPPGTPSGDLVMRAVGSGSWSVDCTATSTRGRTSARDISGSGGESYDVIALRSVIEASCTYTAGSSPLTLTLEEEGMACPFGSYVDGICRTVIAPGDSGQLDFSPA